MTTPTNPHLAKAAEYIGRGEAFYHKAAEEIMAARTDGDGMSWDAIAAGLGRSHQWVRLIVRWHNDPNNTRSPFAGQYDRVQESLTRSKLKTATAAEVRAIVADLPPEAKANLAEAVVDDREAHMAYVRAQRDHQAAVEERVDRAQRERAPRLTHFSDWIDAAQAIRKTRRMYAEALDAARRIDLADDERAALTQTNDEIGRIHGWFASYLESGSGSFDTELAALLKTEEN